jgi:hypothetical protein
MHIATHQATSRDPLVLAGVVATMALIGIIATWIPARRQRVPLRRSHLLHACRSSLLSKFA